jgi:S1-C subfamily serine protease
MIGERTYPAKLLQGESFLDSPVSLLTLSGIDEGAVLDAVSFGSRLDPKVAQTVVVLGGEDGLGVTKTTLTKFHYSKSESTTTPSTLLLIETTPVIPGDYHGGLVVNLDGQAVGISVAGESRSPYIYPASRVINLINAASADVSHGASDKTPVTTVDEQTAAVGGSI